jgi:hypothetical protein
MPVGFATRRALDALAFAVLALDCESTLLHLLLFDAGP